MAEDNESMAEDAPLLSTEKCDDLEVKEREELDLFIRDLQEKIAIKVQLRLENTSFQFPDENYFAKLDSNLKRNTAFVKKVRQFTSAQLDALLKDMQNLNLTKYISEICSALTDAKIKMADIASIITLSSRLHQIYDEFDTEFFEAWQKVFQMKANEKYTNPSKLRVDIRLFADLVSSGVINTKQGLVLLGNVLTNLISQDRDDHSNLPAILSFCRHCGEEYAGLISRRKFLLAEKYNVTIPKSNFLTSEKQQNLRALLKDYYGNFCKHLLNEHAQLINMKNNFKISMTSKGEISTKSKEKCELKQNIFDKLLSSGEVLADILGEELPDLAAEAENNNSSTTLEAIMKDMSLIEFDPWRDEETKIFYTQLPDLKQFLPNFSVPKVDLAQIEEPSVMIDESLLADIDNEIDLDDPPSTTSDPSNERDTAETDDQSSKLEKSEKPTSAKEQGRNNVCGKASKQQFDQFLINLNNCVSKELVDSAAIEFLLNYNTKNNRKKLTKSVISVHRTRWDLLPFLSRFVAIVNLCHSDVATDLSELLRKEFKWHVRMKNQFNIESKIKVVRFMGELVKFGLYKKFDALSCLKILLRDFQHHHIEMACAFIEVAGIYLYNCKDSHWMMNSFLEQMLRLKTVTAMDSRHAAQIENVYYLVKPPETVKQQITFRTPIQEYIRYLIFKELNKQNVDRCIKMMRRINWNDSSIRNYAIKCMSKAYLLRFPLIRCLADLVSGLSSYQEKAVVMVVDNVFEDIRAGLEMFSPKLAQRRIAMAKYLGELYNYKIVDSTNILNTLYSIISLGVSTEEGVESELDPPDSLFRLKLACVLLDTCGPFFTSTSSKQKLNYFLVFFQHYYWHKKSHPVFSNVESTHDLFPILVDHMYRECLSNVRPKLKLYKNLKEAKHAVERLKVKLYPQLEQSCKQISNFECSNLQAIPEDNEMDENKASITSSSELEGDCYLKTEGDEDDEDDITNQVTDWTENELIMEEDMKLQDSKIEKSKEDLEFEQMFEKVTQDSYQERLKETVKPNTKDISVPMLVKSTKKSYEQITMNQKDENVNSKNSLSTDAVPFVLMVRGTKGGKQQFKQFAAPADSPLAINLRLQEEKIREEKERVKRLTLNITERIEEEDYQESLLQSQKNVPDMYSRSTKSKFKHQKGAPDADLIFN